jgi:hypothetical protein
MGSIGHRGKNEMNERPKQPPDNNTMKADKTKQKKGRLGAEIQHKIGQQLRAMYTDVVNEGVPDRFAELLQRLDKQDQK